MAVFSNLQGTTSNQFMVGKKGITLFQGTAVPNNSLGNDGDLYVYRGTSLVQNLLVKQNGSWNTLEPFELSLPLMGFINPNENIIRYVPIRSITVIKSLCVGSAGAAPSNGDAVFTMYLDSGSGPVSIMTITFPNFQSRPTFVFQNDNSITTLNLPAGQIVTIVGPPGYQVGGVGPFVSDSTFSDVAITIGGTRW